LTQSLDVAKLGTDTLQATSKQADLVAQHLPMGASGTLGLAQTASNIASIANSVAKGELPAQQGAANPAAVSQVAGSMQAVAQKPSTVSESIHQASDILRRAGNGELDSAASVGLQMFQGADTLRKLADGHSDVGSVPSLSANMFSHLEGSAGQFNLSSNSVTDILDNMNVNRAANNKSVEGLVSGGLLGQLAGDMDMFKSTFGIQAPDLNADMITNMSVTSQPHVPDFLQGFAGGLSSGAFDESSRRLLVRKGTNASTAAPSVAGTTRPDSEEFRRSPETPSAGQKPQENVDASSMQQDSEARKKKKYIEDIEDELEAAKFHTMFNMVTEVENALNEGGSVCHMLYLTNTQAAKITAEAMPNVRAALKLKEPKMVIRLLQSGFGRAYWKTFKYWDERFPEKVCSEKSEADVEAVEHQLAMLVKEVLLPLAINTHALVIGTESCSLAAAFAQVSAPYQRQMGHKCPFHLLMFTRAPSLEMMRKNNLTSKAYRFSETSKAWKAAANKFHGALAFRYGDDEAFWPHEDIIIGCSQAVIFECLGSSGKLEEEVPERFQNSFISSLAQYLPVIALQTFGNDRFLRLPDVADHVNRGLPLMLLDSRKRTPTVSESNTLPMLEAELKSLSERLHAENKMDQHTTSMLAFVKTVYSNMHQRKDRNGDHDAEKHKWLWNAIEAKRDRLDHKK